MLERVENIYFLGIGGIGMSALARYFNQANKYIEGYDRTQTDLTSKLVAEGMSIHFKDDVKNISAKIKSEKEKTLIIYTPAIPKDSNEFNYFKREGYNIIKRSKALGLIIKYKKGIAVAGTHGKTTISTMIAHIFHNSDYGCNAFMGGIATNYNTNLLINNRSSYVVVEADEFDRSFLQLFPNVAVITSIDADHLDIYNQRENLVSSFNQFANQLQNKGKLVIKKSCEKDIEVSSNILKYTYSLNEKSDFYVRDYEIQNARYIANIATPFGILQDVELGVPALMNLENAVAAIAVAMLEGVEAKQIKNALKSFSGVKRRFEYILNSSKIIYIDDYAHHPEELSACIQSVAKIYKGKKITGIFQPHLFSRTRDFALGFAESLSFLDELILLDIYPAREHPIQGITSKIIFDKVTIENKKLTTKEALWEVFEPENCEVVLTMGAGDIDQLVNPIKLKLRETFDL